MATLSPCNSTTGLGRKSLPSLHNLQNEFSFKISPILSCFHGRKSILGGKRMRRMSINGQFLMGRASKEKRVFTRYENCLLVPPVNGIKPIALIMFLGGAFIGAVPEVTYSYLLELLAKEGFFIVSVPYKVTFDHAQVAGEVYEKFHSCLERLSSSGFPEIGLSAADFANLPLYSVGHSNGALLQVLVGSYFSEKIPEANVIVSFNNKPASVAVPYFDQLGPLVNQSMPIVESSPLYSVASTTSGEAWKSFMGAASTVLKGYDPEAAFSFNKFIDQLPSVINEVAQGTSEFKPTPSENRDFVRESYNVPNTLLVKFDTDAIDETDALEEVIRSRVELTGGTLGKIALPGTHLTPCIQDIRWTVNGQYSPADAVAQGLKSLSLSDTRALATTISNWLKQIKDK